MVRKHLVLGGNDDGDLFAFSYCSWGSQGKNTEVVCHSLLQWTMFCQNSPPWPVCVGCVQFSSVTQLCLTHCDSMDCSMPGFSVHHQLLKPTQTHVHRVDDVIQPSHPLLSPSSPALNLSQNQGLFKWVNSSHQVAKVLELQFQQWTFRTNIL